MSSSPDTAEYLILAALFAAAFAAGWHARGDTNCWRAFVAGRRSALQDLRRRGKAEE